MVYGPRTTNTQLYTKVMAKKSWNSRFVTQIILRLLLKLFNLFLPTRGSEAPRLFAPPTILRPTEASDCPAEGGGEERERERERDSERDREKKRV